MMIGGKMTTRSKVAAKSTAGASAGRKTSGAASSGSTAAGKAGGKKVISALTAQGTNGSSTAAAGQTNRIRSMVAYLEPVDYDKEIPKHPGEAGKLLFEAGFKDAKEVTKIGRFRYKVDLKREEDYEVLLKTDLSKVNLRAFLPASKSETILFVPNVPFDFDDDDVKENIECQQPVLKVERILRMREGKLVKTGSLKVTIRGKEVPRSVRIYGCGFKVELYIFPVKQCRKCWKFGHTQTKCRGDVRCGNCGGSHDDPKVACPNPARCINCKKEHGAGDRNCSERKRNQEINKEMAKRGILFSEAEVLFPLSSNRFEALANEEENGSISLETSGHGEQSNFRSTSGGKRRSASYAKVASTQYEPQDAEGEDHSRDAGGFERTARVFNNPLKATEFERFVDHLRRLFLQQVQQKVWLRQIATLRDMVNNELKGGLEPIDQDRLLITISTELNKIIESASAVDNLSNSRIVEERQNVE